MMLQEAMGFINIAYKLRIQLIKKNKTIYNFNIHHILLILNIYIYIGLNGLLRSLSNV
jgi:hypothetical protein